MKANWPATTQTDLDPPSKAGSETNPPAAPNGAHARRHLLIPREHGAWGMVSLPFLAGALVAGRWMNLETVAAAVAVFSLFLLREPLLVLWRLRLAARKYGPQTARLGRDRDRNLDRRNARWSLVIYSITAVVSSAVLLLSLPFGSLVLLGTGAGVLMVAVLGLTGRNFQRHPVVQIATVMGLTSSSLLSYLAGRGRWEEPALWVWLLSAAHGSLSVLVVHARLEAILATKSPATKTSGPASRSEWRNAVLAQVLLCVFLGLLASIGRAWLVIPFLPPTLLHWWELGKLRSGETAGFPLRRVGWMQLSASVGFCVLLVVVLR